MNGNWFFPSNNYGAVTGIGEASIETFKGMPYCSLAREICQNSLDARLNPNRPVIIEFSESTIQKTSILGYTELQKAMSSCLTFWTEQHNKKTIDFFKTANKIIESDLINILRISDFNTTGLQGSDKEFNTPWNNLVKAVGVSDKNGTAGGSFGIGKAAPFACSDLRTIFYATKDIDGLSAFQGIAKLVSFKEKNFFGTDKDSMTSGTGYYSADKKNTPLRECYSIVPNYKRTKTGTDIFILGFHKSGDWQTEIITSLLEEFLIAIYNNELQIKVCDTIIKSDNLCEIIETYKENAKIAYNYYQVLTDDKAVVYEENIEDLGKAELRVLVKPELHRKIMMCRKNGMKIFDKANISGTIPFAGICILKDDKINEYFREMENPQHNAWEPERHTSDTKTSAKKNMSALYKFVKNKVIELGKRTTIDEMDAEGMGEYFTDAEPIDEKAQDKTEIVSSQTSSIEIEVDAKPPENMGYEQSKDNDNYNEGIEAQDESDPLPEHSDIPIKQNPNNNPEPNQ